MRPVKTRFRFGCAPEGLNLAAEEQLVGSLCKRHTVTPTNRGSDCLWAHGFRFSFTPLSRVLFTFPSRYWYTIGHPGVFSLARWCWRIHAGFLRPRATQDTATPNPLPVRDCHPLRWSFPARFRSLRRSLMQSYNPARALTRTVWAHPRSLATTWGIP